MRLLLNEQIVRHRVAKEDGHVDGVVVERPLCPGSSSRRVGPGNVKHLERQGGSAFRKCPHRHLDARHRSRSESAHRAVQAWRRCLGHIQAGARQESPPWPSQAHTPSHERTVLHCPTPSPATEFTTKSVRLRRPLSRDLPLGVHSVRRASVHSERTALEKLRWFVSWPSSFPLIHEVAPDRSTDERWGACPRYCCQSESRRDAAHHRRVKRGIIWRQSRLPIGPWSRVGRRAAGRGARRFTDRARGPLFLQPRRTNARYSRLETAT